MSAAFSVSGTARKERCERWARGRGRMKRPDARGGRLDARRAKPARARHGAHVGAPSRPSSATRVPGAGSRSAGVSSARAMALGCATGFRPGDRRELRSRRVRGHAVERINGWWSYRFIHCDLLTRRVPACRVERVAPVSASGPKASKRGNSYGNEASVRSFDTIRKRPFPSACEGPDKQTESAYLHH